MKKADIVYFIAFICFGIILLLFYENKDNFRKKDIVKHKKLVMQKTNFHQKEGKIDINKIDEEDLLIRGIKKQVAQGIIEYKTELGVITDIKDLEVIKGVGPATVNKIKKYFYVENVQDYPIKKININSMDAKTLEWLKFTKKEIKAIENWKKEHGSVFCNIDLLKILGEERYEIFSQIIIY